MAIKDINEIASTKKKDKKINEFIQSADMSKTPTQTKTGKPMGRPKKAEADKANKQIFVNLTEEEKQKAEDYAASLGLSISALVKMFLKKEGVI